jgi:hypothetical protein
MTIDSTLREIVEAFVLMDENHVLDETYVECGKTLVSIRWHDTSRIDLHLTTMSVPAGAVRLIVPPGPDVEGGENPNNPPPEYVEPPPEIEPNHLNSIREGVPLLV